MVEPSSTVGERALALEVEADTHLHYALLRMGVAPVKRVSLRNDSADDMTALQLEVRLGSAGVGAFVQRLDVLRAGATHNFAVVDLALDADALRLQRERVTTMLTARVSRVTATGATDGDPEVLAALETAVEVFPLHEWPGTRTLPEILAAFVLPNHPVVGDVLARAAVHLRDATGSGALDGYQSRDPGRAVALAAAIWRALREMAIGYANPPASFEQDGQKVRLPAEIAQHRLATCLDLSLLYAAALEQAGLHPLIVLTRGHAVAGLWLNADTFQEAAVEDGLRLRKRCDLDEIRVIETTSVTSDADDDFDGACRAARRRLADLDTFHCAVDVARSRRVGVLPLPVGTSAGAAAAPVTLPTSHPTAPSVATPSAHAAPAAAAAPAPPEETPMTRLDRWKRKLLDLSLRNRLINFWPTKLSLRLAHTDISTLEDALAGGADFVLRPAPARGSQRTGGEASGGADEARRRGEFLAAELGQRRVHTSLTPEELDARLIDMWRHARLMREESGANVLFLALGTLRWYETPSSDQERQAPLLLLPLELERVSAREGFRVRLGEEDPRVNVTLLEKLAVEFQLGIDGLDELTEDENGIDVHAVLQRFRRAVRDIDRWDVVDEAWIAPFSFSKFLMWRDLQEQKDALLQSPVLQHLVERPGSTFEPDAPFPEAARLDETLPPQDSCCPLDADSSQLAAVVAAASGRSFVLAGPPGTGKSQTIANLVAQCLASGKRVLFVAEKMAALDVVRARLAKVGLGPFCLELHSKESSKRTVLDSMQEALDIGAAREPAEWEKVTTQLADLRQGLNAWVSAMHAPRTLGESVFQVTSALIGLRDAPRLALPLADPERLAGDWVDARREIADALRAAAADLGSLPTHPLRHVQRSRFETTLADRARHAIGECLTSLAQLHTASVGVRDVLGAAAETYGQAAFVAFDALLRGVLSTPGTTDALLLEPGWQDLRPQLLAAVEAVRQKDLQRERAREAFADTLLAQDLEDLLARLRAGMASFWPLSWLRCRSVRAALRPFAKGGHLGADEELARRLEEAIELRGAIAALAKPDHVGARLFGWPWNGGDPGREGWSRLRGAVEWAEVMRAALRALADTLGEAPSVRLRQRAIELAGEDRDALAPGARVGDALRALVAATDDFAAARSVLETLLELDAVAPWRPAANAPWLAHCKAQLASLDAALGDLPAWCHWRRCRAQAAANDLTPVATALESGTLAPEHTLAAFSRAYREAWLAATCDGDPLLRQFAGSEHERRIQRFAELDGRLLEVTRELVRARLAAGVPRGAGSPAANSELGILLRELAKKTRHKPLRRLFAETPNLLPLLKPCFLMSPQSVAQYLAPGHALFDIVVFDEASQITVSDAVGALARGKSAVVVGDSKQLPPTTFFQRLEEGGDDLDDSEIEELESILDECGSAGFQTMRLRWHYRSRHESLIAFSNWHYYDNALYTFPAAVEHSPDLGVSLVPVEDGVYDRSKSRTNRKEAESVVRDVLERLRQADDPARAPSVGIVTFSQAQQTLVETLLDEERRQDPKLEPFFGDAVPEPVFVKNLENVQGDERDVILFSICYGQDVHGKVAMSFGPLNTSGGERRLNVAITRARQQVIVHATLRPDQIDLARTNALGVKHLKTFLDYAARGPQAIAEALVLEPGAKSGSPFEHDVRTALTERGHAVEAQVGCSGYRVDLAVRDPERPGRFLLGIECDGAFYHSATTARDRDRLRQVVLERLGWRLARTWSSDWWRSRERELARLEQRIADAIATGDTEPRPAERTETAPHDDASPVTAPLVDAEATALPPGASVYTPARAAGERVPFEAATPEQISAVIASVLAAEAPMHGELLVRRVGASFDLLRLTARTRARVLGLARALPPGERPIEHAEFLWPARSDPATWPDFRVVDPADDATAREAEHIPPEEIANAALHVVRTQVGLNRQDLVRQTGLLLGFARLGARVRAALASGVELALARGSLAEQSGKVTIAR